MVDGWGIANWARQLSEYYSAGASAAETLEDFATYFAQDERYLQRQRYSNDQMFWRRYLQLPSPKLLSPLTRSDAPIDACSQRLCFDISTELFDRAINAADIFRTSEHSLFLALVAVYFGRVTERRELTLGIPAHNRSSAQHKKMIGLYTSLSPVRIEWQDEWTFVQLLAAVKAEQVKVFRHQKYPLGHMVRDLGAAARGGLFEVGVNYLKLDNRFAFDDASAVIRYVENQYQTTPLNVTVWDNGGHQPVQLQVDFSLNFFTPEDVQLIGARLLHLLAQVAHNPNVRVAELDVVAPIERPLIWPLAAPEVAQALAPELPFITLFEQQVSRHPERQALSYLQQHFSYRELNELAEYLGLQLLARGVVAGQLVGLLLDRRPEMLIAILALHKLGAAYLPLDPSYPSTRLRFMLEDSHCKLVVTTEALLASAPALAQNLMRSGALIAEPVMLDNVIPAWRESPAPIQRLSGLVAGAQAEHLAYVIYTSGSTGTPKGVLVAQRALSNFLQSMAQTPGFSADDWLLAVTPFSFDISIMELLLPLLQGGTVRLFHTALAQDIPGLIRDLHDYPISLLQMTPSAWKLLMAAGWQGAPRLKALTGGEALPGHLAEALVPLVKQLWNMYGPTETTIWSSCERVKIPRQRNTIGKPIAHTQMLILDAQRRVMPVGVFGMLHIGGLGLAEGYGQRPALTAERFIQREGRVWYHTGDIARLLPSGEFEFQGRADQQIKLHGYRIELGSLLSRYPGIANSAVLIKTLASGRQIICAYYQSQTELAEAELDAALARDLPAFMLPARYLRVAAFSQTPSGKTDLSTLPEPELVARHSPQQEEPEQDELTQRLLTLVKNHLNIARLQARDNFFDVGASSTDVMEMAVKISQELAQPLSVIDIFSHASVAALVNFLQDKEPDLAAAQRLKRQETAALGKSRLNSRLQARRLLDEV
jgi:amino acid adenylation domain-containing protein